MALTAQSLFLHGIEVTQENSSLDFRASSGGPELMATLQLGFYSLSSLLIEIVRALQEVDGDNEYSVTADRTVSAGTENRISITSDGAYLDLLFDTGSRAGSSIAPLIGFDASDYTGAVTYSGSSTSGTAVVTNLVGYNFLPPEFYRKNFGSVNVSAGGSKESIVFAVQKFWQARFKYIPYATVVAEWVDLMTWMMLQREIEFTPEISNPNVFYVGTLETTSSDSKGMAYQLAEMLPQFPNFYDTGLMKFRVTEE